MHKRNTTHSNYQHCCVCFPIDDEVTSIKDALFKQIQKAIQQTKKDPGQLQCSKLEPIDFTRLLKMIFNKRFKNLKATTNCKHIQLKKTFTARLDCTPKQIDKICSNLSWKIAKFNFHTDVVILQSKSFLRHITKAECRKQRLQASQIKKKTQEQNSKFIKQQSQQKNAQQLVIQNSLNLQRMNMYMNQPEAPLDHYAYYWPVWRPTQIVLTRPDYMSNSVLKNSQIPTFEQIQEL